MRRWVWLGSLALVAILLAVACGEEKEPPTQTPRAEERGPNDIILATTTSTYDSGLLDVLVPEFEKDTGYNVKVIAVGTGQALAMGERGDADALLVHAPSSEKELFDSGSAINRQLVMHNDFIIVGPEGDRAAVRGMTAAVDALKKLYEEEATFISRGDDSGTHKREMSLWNEAELDPEGQSWYEQSGQGMGATLQIANQKDAYTLSDRGTYLAQSKNLDLVVLVEGDPLLLNVYSVMQVNPERFGLVNGPGGEAFVEFMISEKAQEIIRDFGVEGFGQPLFIPDADKSYEELGLE
ncbi:MAG: substrate-binding domain-containing protein [Dehalococcoidia bacterium]